MPVGDGTALKHVRLVDVPGDVNVLVAHDLCVIVTLLSGWRLLHIGLSRRDLVAIR